MRRIALVTALLLASTAAFAQTSVRQSGNVTPGHAAKWIANGTIGDAGAASAGGLTTLGITANGPGAFCINSGPITSAYNQVCLGVTTNGGTKISSYALGGATTPGITFDINGTTQGFLQVQGAVAIGDVACFADTAGDIKSCGAGVGLTVGTTTVTSGTTTRVLYDNAGVVGEYAISGTGSVVMTNTPTLVTPVLGVATGTSIALGTTLSVGSSVSASGSINIAAAAAYYWDARAQLLSPADGIIKLANNANTDFTRLQLGGTTSAFPSIKRSSAAVAFRLADDSADAAITAASFTGSAAASFVGSVTTNASARLIQSRNLSNGSGAFTETALGNDSTSTALQIGVQSSANTLFGVAGSAYILANAGLSVRTGVNGSASDMTLYTNNLALTINGTTQQVAVADATDSSSSTTGSLITAGGLGVAKALTVGTTIAAGTSPLAIAGITPVIAASGSSATNTISGLGVLSFSSSGINIGMVNFYRSLSATYGAATVVTSGDGLGGLTWYGAQQTGTFSNANIAARIVANVDGTVTNGASADMPGRLVFMTTPDGSGTATERMRISNTGHTTFTTTAPALTSCGTSPTIVGNDVHGTVTMGTGAPTGCVITFNVAYTAAPNCNVTWRSTPLLSQSYTVSTTAITTTQTATSSNIIDYNCWGT